MSDSELHELKQKIEKLSHQLEEKENCLQEYRETIDHSNKVIKEAMNKLALEMNLANKIHRILLPVELPVIRGCVFSFKFRPSDANKSGKDFYEIIPHRSRHCFSIIMSSCSSYSLSSVLFSARLKILGRTESSDRLQPHEFVTNLLDTMHKDHSNDSLKIQTLRLGVENFDLFYAVVDQKTYEMSYCLLGNMTALVQKCNNTSPIQVMSSHTASGTDGGWKHIKTNTFSLNSKDRFILCSPGVLASQDPSGQNYSLLALTKALAKESSSPVHELRNRILYEIDSFSQGRTQQRDQSVLVMEVNKNILKLATNT